MFVCPLRLFPATLGWGLRRGCVFGLGFRLRPATPGWAVGMCVCSCARSTCTPPLLAGVFRVVVCAWAWVSAAPRLSWRGCWGVCVFVCPLRLFPATPGWGVRCGFVCLGTVSAAPRHSWLCLGCVCVCVSAPLVPRHSWLGCAAWVCVFGLRFPLRPAALGWGVGVCVCVCPPRLYPATPGWGGQCGCVCLGSGFGCAPPLLAGVLGCVCVCVRAPPVPRHSWLGCVVWVCVHGLGLRLRPAAPGWGVGVCLFVCALRLYPATPGWGVRRGCVGWVLPGTCSCAVVRCVLCALPGFAAPGGRCRLAPVRVPWFWPATCLSGVPCGPALVRRASSGPVTLGATVGFPDDVVPFPIPGACDPGFAGRLRGAHGGRPGTGLFVPAACPCQGRGSGLAPRRSRSGPRDGVVPGGSLRRWSWAARAVVVGVFGPGHWRVRFPVPSVVRRGTLLVHRGCFVWTPTPPLAGRGTPRPGPARVCVRVLCLAESGRPASWARCGAPHLFFWPLCPCSLSGLLRAWVALFVVCFFFFFPLCAPDVSGVPCLPARDALGIGVLFAPPPSFFLSFFFSAPPPCFIFCSLVS